MNETPPRFLQRIEAFHDLQPAERKALIDACSRFSAFDAHRDILVEGHDGGSGCILEDGWACRYRMLNDGRRQILNFLLPGDLIAGADRSAWPADHSVSTLTFCRVFHLDRGGLPELCRRYPRLQQIADWMVQRELSIVQERIVDIGRRNASERVGHLLLELMFRLRPVGLCKDCEFELPLTQEMIADALGLSIVHVNRTLRRLDRNGLIAYTPGQVDILDEADLAALAEFDASYLHQGEALARNGNAA